MISKNSTSLLVDKKFTLLFRVVDLDPDRVGSASFCRIQTGIGIQVMPIRIDINQCCGSGMVKIRIRDEHPGSYF
jgi:hypothetical protein